MNSNLLNSDMLLVNTNLTARCSATCREAHRGERVYRSLGNCTDAVLVWINSLLKGIKKVLGTWEKSMEENQGTFLHWTGLT